MAEIFDEITATSNDDPQIVTSALFLATMYNQTNIVQLLLNYGADAAQESQLGGRGFTSACLAAEYGYAKIVEIFITNDIVSDKLDIDMPKTKPTDKHKKHLEIDSEILKEILHPLILYSSCGNGFTLMETAIAYGYMDIIELISAFRGFPVQDFEKRNILFLGLTIEENEQYKRVLQVVVNQNYSQKLHWQKVRENNQARREKTRKLKEE